MDVRTYLLRRELLSLLVRRWRPKARKPKGIMIDATHLKAHRTAAGLLKEGDVPSRVGRTKGGLNSTMHTVCDGQGRPIIMVLREGQMSDHIRCKFACL